MYALINPSCNLIVVFTLEMPSSDDLSESSPVGGVMVVYNLVHPCLCTFPLKHWIVGFIDLKASVQYLYIGIFWVAAFQTLDLFGTY